MYFTYHINIHSNPEKVLTLFIQSNPIQLSHILNIYPRNLF